MGTEVHGSELLGQRVGYLTNQKLLAIKRGGAVDADL
jgi:hypothetical protein